MSTLNGTSEALAAVAVAAEGLSRVVLRMAEEASESRKGREWLLAMISPTPEEESEAGTLALPSGRVVRLEPTEITFEARELGRIVDPFGERGLEPLELDGEPEADPGRGWVEAPPAVLVPEPPGELPAHLDRRLTAIENRLGEVHKLADRAEVRLDAQLGRIVELEALGDAQRVTLEALQAAGTPTQARLETTVEHLKRGLDAEIGARADSFRTCLERLESADAVIAAARRHGIIR